jgi:phosphonate transport system permease protein
MSKVMEMRTPSGAPGARTVWSVLAALVVLALFVQAWIVVQARPQDLITGAHGMADIMSRAMPPAFDQFVPNLWPVLETIDLAIFGTVFGVLLAFPLAILAAANLTPALPLYYAARSIIGVTRAVPDLVWALLFVTAVGLGPFPGALALAVHSVGMLGRLFAEVIEDMDMGPVEALTLIRTGHMRRTRFRLSAQAFLVSVGYPLTLMRVDAARPHFIIEP